MDTNELPANGLGSYSVAIFLEYLIEIIKNFLACDCNCDGILIIQCFLTRGLVENCEDIPTNIAKETSFYIKSEFLSSTP